MNILFSHNVQAFHESYPYGMLETLPLLYC